MPESDWDAVRYHRISDPQLGWARAVAARLRPAAGERILDLGCGTARLTTEISATPGILVVGLDPSFAMLSEANKSQRVLLVRGDGTALPFSGIFDAVFSAATFHWIADHDRLFASIYQALKPGGRLVSQCGGGANLQRLYERARRLQQAPQYKAWFASWSDPWRFEGVSETEARLARAGFTAIEVSLVSAPTTLSGAEAYAEFVECVCLRHQLDRLPRPERGRFLADVTAQAAADDPPYTLDYWRLNMSGRRQAS
jgi:trans-aconitate 2-methyltransferase